MESIRAEWDNYKDAVPAAETIVSEASYFAGALAALIIIAEGGKISQTVQEIEMYAIDCPTFKPH